MIKLVLISLCMPLLCNCFKGLFRPFNRNCKYNMQSTVSSSQLERANNYIPSTNNYGSKLKIGILLLNLGGPQNQTVFLF